MLKKYNVRIVHSKAKTEYWLYDEPIYTGYTKFRKSNRKNIDEMNKEELIESASRRKKYLKNLRYTIARLIDANLTDKTSFLTLTFAENVTDIAWANNELTKFIKRLKNYTKIKLKYLWTWENQSRGAIHYHMVLFNIPYIPLSALNKLWKHGYVQINKINIDSPNNIGRYISKYFSKAFENRDLHNVKLYSRSRNLIIPKEEMVQTDIDDLQSTIEDFACYQNEYQRYVGKDKVQKVKYFVLNNKIDK